MNKSFTKTYTAILAFLIQASVETSALNAAHQTLKPFPSHIKSAHLIISAEKTKKGRDFPRSAYVDSKRKIVYTGHQLIASLSALAYLAGGLPAMVITDARDRHRGRSQSESEVSIGTNFIEFQTKEEFLDPSYSSQISTLFDFDESSTSKLIIDPYLFITGNKRKELTLSALILISLYETDHDAKPIWRTRIFAQDPNTFSEEDLQNGNQTQLSVQNSIKYASWCFHIIANESYKQYSEIQIRGRLPGIRHDLTRFDCALLEELNGMMLVRIVKESPVNPFGYNIVPRINFEINATEKIWDTHKRHFIKVANLNASQSN